MLSDERVSSMKVEKQGGGSPGGSPSAVVRSRPPSKNSLSFTVPLVVPFGVSLSWKGHTLVYVPFVGVSPKLTSPQRASPGGATEHRASAEGAMGVNVPAAVGVAPGLHLNAVILMLGGAAPCA